MGDTHNGYGTQQNWKLDDWDLSFLALMSARETLDKDFFKKN